MMKISEKEISNQLGLMKDPDPFVRRDAIGALSGIKDGRILYPLIKALQDENHGIQQAAMDALMEFEDEAAVYGLLPLLSDPRPFVRNMSREILDRIGGCGLDIVRGYLNDKNEDVRKVIADILGSIRKPEARDLLIHMLKDPCCNVRSSAAEGLGKIGDPLAVESIISLLDDEKWVAMFAVSSLGRLRDIRAVEPLSRLIFNSVGDMQVIAIEALAQIGGEEAKASLMEIIKSSGPEAVSAAVKGMVKLTNGHIGEAVKIIGAERFYDYLSKSVNDIDQEYPCLKTDLIMAFSLIKNQKSSCSILDLISAVEPEDMDMILVATDALTRLHEEETLIESLNRENKSCLVTVIRTLGNLKSEKAVRELIQLYENVDRDIKIEILSALASIGDKDSSGFIINMLSFDEGHIRGAAARSLGILANPETTRFLLERIEVEEYPDIIEEVISALIQIGVKNNLLSLFDDLTQNLSNKKPFVRETILKGLCYAGWEKVSEFAKGMLSDEGWRVRKTCLEVLSHFNDPALPEILITASTDEKDEIRMFVAQLAGRFQDESFIDLLISFLSDRNTRVIHKAISGLVGLKAKKAVPYLIKIARKEDALLQQLSIWALGELADREAEALIKETLNHHNAEVKSAAIEAYKKLKDSDNAIY